MIGSIGFINTTAYWTSLAGVPRINEDHWDACQLSLVSNIALKLIERPVSVLASLLASNRSLTDSAQIFKSDSPLSVLRFLNKTLADRVVGITLKPGLLAGDFLEFMFCRFGLLLLKVLTAMLEFAAVIIDYLAGELLTVAINCQIDYSKITTENVVNVLRFWRLNVTGGKQVEIAFDKSEIAFSTLALKHLFLSCPANKRDALATFDRPDRDLIQVNVPLKNTTIESNRSGRFKSPSHFSVDLIAVNNLGDAADNNLSGEVELFTNVVVNQFVQRYTGKSFMLPCLFGNIVASSISRLKRLFESRELFRCWLKLDLCGEFHTRIISQFVNLLKVKEAAFLSPMNGGVSSGIFL